MVGWVRTRVREAVAELAILGLEKSSLKGPCGAFGSGPATRRSMNASGLKTKAEVPSRQGERSFQRTLPPSVMESRPRRVGDE